MLRPNVIRLQRPRTFTSAEKLIEEVRQGIFADGRKYSDIARLTGVSATTVGNLARGKTIWPRSTTLFPMLGALGLSIQLVRGQRWLG